MNNAEGKRTLTLALVSETIHAMDLHGMIMKRLNELAAPSPSQPKAPTPSESSFINWADERPVAASPAEGATPAKPIFSVRLRCGIGSYRGEWTGKEQQYEDKTVVLLETESLHEAEQFFERVKAVHPSTPQARADALSVARAIAAYFLEPDSETRIEGHAEQIAPLISAHVEQSTRELRTALQETNRCLKDSARAPWTDYVRRVVNEAERVLGGMKP